MLRLRANRALSDFRLEKLLAVLREREPSVSAVYAEYFHFVDLEVRPDDPRRDSYHSHVAHKTVMIARPEL